MQNSNLANEINEAVQNALQTNNFSKLKQSISEAVNTSIAQIGTEQNRFYSQYTEDETTIDQQLEHVDGEIVTGSAKADFNARRRAAHEEAERARANSRRGQGYGHPADNARERLMAARRAADARRREEASRRSQSEEALRREEAARRTEAARRAARQRNAVREGNQPASSADLVPISRHPAGRVSGTLFTVFGWMGLVGAVTMFALCTLFNAQHIMPDLIYGNLMGLICFPSAAISGGMVCVGSKRRHRVQRFYQYVRQFRGRAYCSIRELSSHIGRSDRFVLRDLRKMISLGMFPEGHIDDQNTCIMLNGATYDQYRKTQNAYLLRESGKIPTLSQADSRDASAEKHSSGTSEADQTTDAAKTTAQTSAGKPKLSAKVMQVLSAGDGYLTKIREANAAIPGKVISEKLDRLEEVIRKIYSRIEEHPEQIDELNKFITYYLPTTLKLVNAYRDFDAQSIQGENIANAKKEIEATLDTIIYAFEALLDSLFADDALDISTDISVLQTMFAQEGLTKSAFKE